MRSAKAMAWIIGLLLASPALAQAPAAEAQREAMFARAKAAEISDAGTRPGAASFKRSLALVMALVPPK